MFYELLLEKLAATWKSQRKQREKCLARRRRSDGALLRVEPLEDRRLLSVAPWGWGWGWQSRAYSHNSSTSTTSTATITLQNRPSTSQYGQSVLMTATVSGTTGGSVEFLDGATDLGSVNLSGNGIANYVTNSLPLGSNSITAEYFASGVATSGTPTATSTPVSEYVNAASTRTVVTAPGNPLVAGSNVTFTAIVSSGTTSGQGTAPVGTVAFTVYDDTTDTAVPGTTTYANGVATFTTTSPTGLVADNNYAVSATFTPSNGEFSGSASGVLVEQVVAASAVGVGSVEAGTADTPVDLRGGGMLSIDVTQALSSSNTLTETGNGVTYSNGNIDFSSTSITSVVFSSNGYQAEITGTGDVGNTSVTFTLIVSSGSGADTDADTPCPASISRSRARASTTSSRQRSATAVFLSTRHRPSHDINRALDQWRRRSRWRTRRLGRWRRPRWRIPPVDSPVVDGGSAAGPGSTGTGSTGTGSGGSGSGGWGGSGSGSTGTGSGGGGSGGSGSTTTGSAVQSSNWSGYAAETNLNDPASGAVTAVSGSWVVPKVTPTSNSSTAYSSVWVGIDGYSSSTVEQIGTDSDVVNGQVQYYAWVRNVSVGLGEHNQHDGFRRRHDRRLGDVPDLRHSRRANSS